MGELVASFDWSNTLGEVSGWPQSLRTAVGICLASRFPIVMYWGPEYVLLYNDAYSSILARKHPWALGRSAREVWKEIWDVIGPMLNRVMATGQATLSDDLLLFLERYGYSEECYFSFSFSPIHIEAGIVGGVFCAVKETTSHVIGDRRLRTLRDLAARTSETKTVADACLRSAEVLGENAFDVPFALIYLVSGSTATLAGAAGIDIDGPDSPASVNLSAEDGAGPWEVGLVVRTGQPKTIDTVSGRCYTLPYGKWSISPGVVQVLPLGQDRPFGILVAAVSPHRNLDDEYLTFFSLLARQVTSAIADARAHEEKGQRIAALTDQLRRVNKDMETFAYSASHDLEEPLRNITMSAQLLKRDHGAQFEESAVKLLDGVIQGAFRMETLVKDLLAYSRATRTPESVPAMVDARAVLTEVLYILKTRIEESAAVVAMDRLPPVAMHRSHLSLLFQNLIGNALKYRGRDAPRVHVSAIQRDGAWVFSVMDNGIGIEPKYRTQVFGLFKRLHSRGKYPGNGVGLAICQRIVEQYGGSIWVDAAPGGGSIFSFSIPEAGLE